MEMGTEENGLKKNGKQIDMMYNDEINVNAERIKYQQVYIIVVTPEDLC